MIELSYLGEMDKVKAMPQEIQETVQDILQILDIEYGAARDKYADDGGYVIVLEEKEDFAKIKDKTYIDCDNIIAEYVDKIVCSHMRKVKPSHTYLG